MKSDRAKAGRAVLYQELGSPFVKTGLGRGGPMLEPEIVDLRDALLGRVTNSQMQATRWAREIIEEMQSKGWNIVTDDALDGG